MPQLVSAAGGRFRELTCGRGRRSQDAIGTYNGVEIFWDGEQPGQFVNATQMCKAAGKRWAKYWENQSTQEFVAILAEDLKCPNSDLCYSRPGNQGGTWVHVDIALHLAQWCCPKFHLWCNRQIRQLVTTGSVSLKNPLDDVRASLRESASIISHQQPSPGTARTDRRAVAPPCLRPARGQLPPPPPHVETAKSQASVRPTG